MEAIVAADVLRRDGVRAGVIGLRVFRPFPRADILRALQGCRLAVVFDRSISYGNEGTTCNEIKAALYGSGIDAKVHNFIVGLGGRDVKARELADAVKRTPSSANRDAQGNESAEWICEI
jgi:pyruvate/2-oxoacid:ferredoxin oxidoreductase alpha subunit